MNARTATYLLPPVICERLADMVARWGGHYLEVAAEAGAGVDDNRVALLPQGRVFGSGTVLSPDGRSVAIDVSTDFGGPTGSHWLLNFRKIRPPVRIPETAAVIAVNLGTRYCHWLLEELPRLLSMERSASTGLIVNQRAPVIREACEVGRLTGPFWTVGRNTHFECEQLLIPGLIGRAGDPTPQGVKLVTEFTAPWRGTASIYGERIYVSRENAERRRVVNDAELWQQLKGLGFNKLRLEELTWREQISAFAHAREVVAPHGAGLANLVFSAAGTRVVEFFHRAYVNPCFGRLAVIKGLDYRPLVAAGAEALRCEPRGNRLDLHADVPAILAALRKN